MAYRTQGQYGGGLGVAASLKERARMLYANGQAAFSAGRYGEALSAFQDAYRAIPNPVVLVAMATALERLGRFQEARQKYEDYLRLDPEGAERPRAMKAIAQIDKALEKPDAPPVAAPALPPEPYTADQGTTIGVWVVTGVGVVGLIGAAIWASRRRRVRPNRRRRRRR